MLYFKSNMRFCEKSELFSRSLYSRRNNLLAHRGQPKEEKQVSNDLW